MCVSCTRLSGYLRIWLEEIFSVSSKFWMIEYANYRKRQKNSYFLKDIKSLYHQIKFQTLCWRFCTIYFWWKKICVNICIFSAGLAFFCCWLSRLKSNIQMGLKGRIIRKMIGWIQFFLLVSRLHKRSPENRVTDNLGGSLSVWPILEIFLIVLNERVVYSCPVFKRQ